MEELVRNGIEEVTERAHAYREIEMRLQGNNCFNSNYRLSISDAENLSWAKINEIADRTYFRSTKCAMREIDHEDFGGNPNDYETFFSEFYKLIYNKPAEADYKKLIDYAI